MNTESGYEIETNSNVLDTGSFLSNNFPVSERGEKKDMIEMLDGFKETHEPLPYEEKRHIGKIEEQKAAPHIKKRSYIEESEDEIPSDEYNPEFEEIESDPDMDENESEDLIAEEEEEDDDEPNLTDSTDGRESDFKRRSAIVDSDEDIVGSELSESEPNENPDDSSDSLLETEKTLEDPSLEPAEYDRLLSEFEEDKEGVSGTSRFRREKIPKPEDYFSEEFPEDEPDPMESADEENLDELQRDDIDKLLHDDTDYNDELEEKCVEPGKKRSIIEYLDADDPTGKFSLINKSIIY
ncbi:hypothetical protein RF11_07122 [Thelohanellus kitauei]|uniref:Uncharacterized protein n=1 Tax=Thelohanellus kitauei TaxID=669202 RepID=A0A0C2M3D9_THEKT|nr:hypothetical protein RF11_07122 [Thelohanellus kitauei]